MKTSLLSGLLALAVLVPLASAGAESQPFTTLPEMAPVHGYVAFARAERQALESEADVAPALEAAEAHARALWPRLRRELDLVALSSAHVEVTRGFELPSVPELEVRVLGRDEDGALHVDVRGPRLPARYAIVHRHLHLLAVVPADGAVERVTVTIRTVVYE